MGKRGRYAERNDAPIVDDNGQRDNLHLATGWATAPAWRAATAPRRHRETHHILPPYLSREIAGGSGRQASWRKRKKMNAK